MTLTAPSPDQTGARATGRIAQIIGPVVDVEFPPEQLPEIYFALELDLSQIVGTGDGAADSTAMKGVEQGTGKLVLEVQQHLGNNTVRAVAMGPTDGLRRGIEVRNTGAPISVPVGPPTLGRLFNVLGEAIDGKGPVEAGGRHPIHLPPPAPGEQAEAPAQNANRVQVSCPSFPFRKSRQIRL